MKKGLIVLILGVFFISCVSATTYYVDNSLTSNCVGDTYSIINRDCSGSDGRGNQHLGQIDLLVSTGDIVYIRGGTYNENGYSMDCFWGGTNSGTETEPIIIQAYPGETPIFTGGAGCGGTQVIINLPGDWYVFDGLRFERPFDNGGVYHIHISGNHNEIKNFNGEARTTFVRLDNKHPIECAAGSYNKIHDNIIDGSSNACGGPGCNNFIYTWSGCFNEYYNNIITDFGHAAIGFNKYADNDANPPSKYNKAYNNTIDQSNGGGGIMLPQNAAYNLVENNIITNIGKLAGLTQPKAGIHVRGDHNTIRNNIVSHYATGTKSNLPIGFQSQYSYGQDNCQYNLVYNNIVYFSDSTCGRGITVYENGDSSLGFLVDNNVFANNIVYMAPSVPLESCNGNLLAGYYSTVYWDEYWQTGTKEFARSNVFKNNYFNTGTASSLSNMVTYSTGLIANNFHKDITTIEIDHPLNFFDNIDDDGGVSPFIDENSGNFNLDSVSGAALVNSGAVINDTNGEYVESNYPGYGWEDLSYLGSAPDIGAYEYTDGTNTSCSEADTSKNSIVEIGELLAYISLWKSGSVAIGELLTAISEWKSGC